MTEFVHRFGVRYLEVDQQGVVFNMWYLGYLDEAMTAFLAHHGLSFRTLLDAGYDVQLVHAELDWRDGLRWQDDASVAVRLARLGTTSFTLGFQVRRADEAVASAEVVYVCVAAEGGGKRTLPDLLLAGLGANPREPSSAQVP